MAAPGRLRPRRVLRRRTSDVLCDCLQCGPRACVRDAVGSACSRRSRRGFVRMFRLTETVFLMTERSLRIALCRLVASERVVVWVLGLEPPGFGLNECLRRRVPASVRVAFWYR